MFTTAAQRNGTPLTVRDEVPVAPRDPRGVVPFYLNVGYVLGGYLASTVLGIGVGTAPRTLRRAGLRIAALAVYSVLLGVAGALVVGPGAFRGMHLWNAPGLANDPTRSAVYFDWRSAGWPAAGLALWSVVGAAGLLTAALVRGRCVTDAGRPTPPADG
ncbi:hypothetical protein AB0J20_24915 [Micromonospora costi]|uniref:hypothetical protein n=1 Tax=Micromonospora costi TaxID=1530042 RepID=UPI0033F9445F